MRPTGRTCLLSCCVALLACGSSGLDGAAADPDAASGRDAGASRADAPGAVVLDRMGSLAGEDATGATLEAPDPPPAPAPASPVELDDGAPSNFSFETARTVRVDDATGILQQVLSADQVDHYAFEGEAGAFYEVLSSRGPFTPDNLITLHGPDREPLAENDEGWLWGGDGIDARLVVRLQRSGTHYLTVEDRYTPAGYFLAEETPVLFYRLTIARIEQDTGGFTFAGHEGAAPVSFRRDEGSGFSRATLLGSPAGGALDLFDFQGADAQALIGRANPGGSGGNGSTSSGGTLQVLDAAQRVVARIDRAQGLLEIHPPVSDQSYQIGASASSDSNAVAGDNDFYAIDLVLLPDNPSEEDELQNDGRDGAQQLVMEGGARRRGLLLSRLQPADVDHYRFDAQQGEALLVSCEARSAGSGVLGLSAELQDATGAPIAFARESDTDALWMDGIRAPSDGPLILVLRAEALDEGIIGDWVRCVVIIDRP